jgi:hypothetical protein
MDLCERSDTPMQINRLLVADQIRFQGYEEAMHLTARNQLYANPAAMAALESTCPRVAAKCLAFDQRAETEIAIHWVEKGTLGSHPISRRENERTGLFSFGPVLALYPALKVSRGWVRRIPYRIDPTPEGKLFVLDLAQSDVIPSQRRRPKAKVE